jgi:hypothetical protein
MQGFTMGRKMAESQAYYLVSDCYCRSVATYSIGGVKR